MKCEFSELMLGLVEALAQLSDVIGEDTDIGQGAPDFREVGVELGDLIGGQYGFGHIYDV